MSEEVNDEKYSNATPQKETVETKEHISGKSKSVNLIYALGISIGNIIGSGIFRTVGHTFNVFGSEAIGMVTLFWIFGGIIALFGGLCYAELGTIYPESGGERVYYNSILNNKIAKVFVITFIFAIKSINIAGMAIISGEYFIKIFSSSSENKALIILFAILAIIMCFGINCISKTLALKAGIIFTALKIIGIIMVVGFGITSFARGNTTEWEKPFDLKNFTFGGLGKCVSSLLWSYEGWNSLGLIAGEMKNPERDLPASILLGVSIVTIMYTLAVVSYCAVLGYARARTESTIAMAAAQIMIGKASPIVALLIWFSVIGAMNGNIFMVACTANSAGVNGEIPKIFSLVQKNSRTPIFSLVIIVIFSTIFTFFSLDNLLIYSSFLNWIFYSLSFFCLFKIKRANPTKSIVFKLNYFAIFPLVLFCIFLLGISFYDLPIGCTLFSLLFIFLYGIQYLPKKYHHFTKLVICQQKMIDFLCSKLPLALSTREDIS